ncbi:MAG: adenylate/guanylate cyclase domain-containing protein [Myxococcaceae bacterium]|nr:adenylate/guanylate cyclase domain-containing protein [Myxococcaceae bacterium]
MTRNGRLLTVLGSALLATLTAALLPRELEWRVEDQLVRTFRSGALRSTTVTIVAIDDRTLEGVAANEAHRLEFGDWPYDRTLWGRVVLHLGKLGARAVVLDGTLEGRRDDGAGDENLAEALRTPGALPFFAGLSTTAIALLLPADAPLRTPLTLDGVTPRALDRLDRHDAQGATTSRIPLRPQPPSAALATAVTRWGLLDAEADDDGVLRRTTFARGDENGPWPTLALAVASHLTKTTPRLTPGALTVGDRTVPLGGAATARLDYGGRLLERFDTLSLFHVIDDLGNTPPTLPRERFEGRVIVLAGFALGTADVRATPFERSTPGVVKHATELDALLGTGSFLRATPTWFTLLFAAVLGGLTSFLVTRSRRAIIELGVPTGFALAVFFVAGALLKTTALLLSPLALVVGPLLAGALSAVANRVSVSKDKDLLRDTFGRYMERQLVDQLVDGKDLRALDAKVEDITVFFSDIKGFSAFSEALRDKPEVLKRVLNVYLTRVTKVLFDEGACIDKYIGDAVVALFGAPVPMKDHAGRACLAALRVQEALRELNAEFAKEGLPDVSTRIGLNTDALLVGNFGSEQLTDYTAIGDGMNLAARLEAANKAFGTSILVGPETARRVHGVVEVRELDSVRVAGKQEIIPVFEVMGRAGHLTPTQLRLRDLYAQALEAWRQRKPAEATRLLDAALQLVPDDGPSLALRVRSESAQWEPVSLIDPIRNLKK